MTDNQQKFDAPKNNPKATASKQKPSKKARLEAMLNRPRGATQKQLEKSFGWQPHTVRAAISRLRKNGAEVTLDRSARTPAYRIDAVS